MMMLQYADVLLHSLKREGITACVVFDHCICISVFDAGTMEVMGQVLHVSWS